MLVGLDDLCVRFIINLPQEDLSSVARICFQVEEAQWFYEDFIRPLDPTLPSMSLRIFCLRIFQHCPLLASFSNEHHTKAFEEFLQYKTRVPVRGAIMLNQAMDSAVLVKGWKKGASWSFPRGKINKDEDDLDCAIREVYEETGLDLRATGLAPTEKKPKYIEISMREQQLRLYIFRDIPMATDFQPRTRKEISKIQWYKLSDLPAFRKKGAQNRSDAGGGSGGSKFYMVAPFLVPLKKWIVSQKRVDDTRAVPSANHADQAPNSGDLAWAPEPLAAPNRPPALEDLHGAKQGIEHLFGAQIPSGSQTPHEDKGSALLSILKVGGQRGATHMPQTPLDLTTSNPPQPRNPHHHSNQHSVPADTHANEAPPAFQLPPKPSALPSVLPPTHAADPRSASDNAAAMAQRLYSMQEEPSLAHTQSLPPKTQMFVLNQSVFHGPPSAHRMGRCQPRRGNESPPAKGQMPSQLQAIQPPPRHNLTGTRWRCSMF